MFTSLFYNSINNASQSQSQSQSIVPISTVTQPTISKPNFSLFGITSGTTTGPIISKVGFDDILYYIKHYKKTPTMLLINTMPVIDQDFLIRGTMSYQVEESRINEILDDYRTDLNKYTIFLYVMVVCLNGFFYRMFSVKTIFR